MIRFQLYQRLRAQATKLFGLDGGRRVRVIRTVVTVEQERRLWLIPQTVVQDAASTAQTGDIAGTLSLPEPEIRPALGPGESTAQIPDQE